MTGIIFKATYLPYYRIQEISVHKAIVLSGLNNPENASWIVSIYTIDNQHYGLLFNDETSAHDTFNYIIQNIAHTNITIENF